VRGGAGRSRGAGAAAHASALKVERRVFRRPAILFSGCQLTCYRRHCWFKRSSQAARRGRAACMLVAWGKLMQALQCSAGQQYVFPLASLVVAGAPWPQSALAVAAVLFRVSRAKQPRTPWHLPLVASSPAEHAWMWVAPPSLTHACLADNWSEREADAPA
jgi:hypothetical protein